MPDSLKKFQSTEERVCFELVLTGFVQGVGFRPFVFKLANQLNINGSVTNHAGQVSIVAEANRETLEQFCQQLISQAPVYAKPLIQSVKEISPLHYNNFSIAQSNETIESDIHILPDLPTCDQCLHELFDKKNRRYYYPFINCTQCGPRNSIISSLPYDRKNTSMQGFKFCEKCEQEYNNPEDRRFHAEPVACEVCGPVLTYDDQKTFIEDNQQALEACINAFKQGLIVAVKGVSGYHLMCDATSSDAIARLRQRKQRPDKPFAVLMRISQLDDYVVPTQQERKLLSHSSRPVVLMNANPISDLADNLAPDLKQTGVMLPNNPLQHLICELFQKPLVATSGNISGEPVIHDNDEARVRLQNICDVFLHHNRDIVRPADDPVMQVNDLGVQLIRTGRGLTPTEVTLPFVLDKPVLAVGGHIKNTIALAWKNRLVISSHHGDLGSLRSYQTFQQTITDLQQLYQVKADEIICDAHPGYSSTKWAKDYGLTLKEVFHHYAHASSLFLENNDIKSCLVFAWDGVGLGADGSLWGGEIFLGAPGKWQRVCSFKPFRLPGGELTSRQAWRVAASLNWHAGIEYDSASDASKQVKMVWDKKINCPTSSAAGRLFSAAASLLGLVDNESFEGHAPMLLQAYAEQGSSDALTLPVSKDESGLDRIDWRPLVTMLNNTELAVNDRARCFHETLANTVSIIALQYGAIDNDLVIGLSGGVFQNKLLVKLIHQRLKKHGLSIVMPESIPVNDGGLSAGQIIESYFNEQ